MVVGVLMCDWCASGVTLWLWEGLCSCVCLCAVLEGCVTASLSDPASLCGSGILFDAPEEEENLCVSL